ncbi:MAG: hypothetical protein HKP61_23090 [Dactylosporangium sp.]|nr:hypothetical protein [Dactylosporangium sp.]NNJ63765.1 hypothetical protein [Dactylosporangium sp.]
MIRTWTMAEMTLRDLIRRRTVVGLLFLLPLVFYLARRDDHTGQAVKFLLLGLGFTSSAAGLFATSAARSLEPRLRLGGYRTIDLYVGRLIALIAVGLAIAVPYLAVVLADQDVQRMPALALALALTVLVAAPLGMLLGSALARDMEGVLLLLAVTSAQFLTDPAKISGRVMPFWSAREIATYAVDLTDIGYLRRGVTHALVCAAILFVATAAIAAVRLRRRRHVRIVSSSAPV